MANCGIHDGLRRCRRIGSRFDSDSLSIADTLDQISPPTACYAPEVRRLLDDGTVRAVIDSTFPLSEARQSHGRAAKGHIQGKIVLTVE
jgi:NADPH:quinone reductase-like Zn-dependent oxidoreductase